MSWIRLDDQIPRHDKIAQVGPAAAWIWVCCIAHCQSQLTDGFVSDTAMRVILTTACASDFEAAHQSNRPTDEVYASVRALADRLVVSKLLDRVDCGYQVHDYLEHNPSKASVLEKRREDLKRKGKFHAESARNPDGIRADSKNFPRADSSRARAPAPASDPIHTNKQQQRGGPIFQGQRIVVMPFMQEALERILGTDGPAFELGAWYWTLDAKYAKKPAVNMEWPWLKREMLKEARTRGLLLGSANEINAREQGRSASRINGGSQCQHEPRCKSNTDCIALCLEEGRRERAASQ